MFNAAFAMGAASVSAASVADHFEVSPWGYRQALRWLEAHHPLALRSDLSESVDKVVRLANELYRKDTTMSETQTAVEDQKVITNPVERQQFLEAIKAKADAVIGVPFEEGQSVKQIVEERVNATVSGILAIIDGKEAVPGYHLIQATTADDQLYIPMDISGDLVEGWFDLINT